MPIDEGREDLKEQLVVNLVKEAVIKPIALEHPPLCYSAKQLTVVQNKLAFSRSALCLAALICTRDTES